MSPGPGPNRETKSASRQPTGSFDVGFGRRARVNAWDTKGLFVGIQVTIIGRCSYRPVCAVV